MWPTMFALAIGLFDFLAVVVFGVFSIRVTRQAAQDGARAAAAAEASVREARAAGQRRRLERVLDELAEVFVAVLALVEPGRPGISQLPGDLFARLTAAQARLRVVLVGFSEDLPLAARIASTDHSSGGLNEMRATWDKAASQGEWSSSNERRLPPGWRGPAGGSIPAK